MSEEFFQAVFRPGGRVWYRGAGHRDGGDTVQGGGRGGA